MTNDAALLTEVATDLFGDLCPPETVREAEETGWSAEMWQALTEAGFPLVSVPEKSGGSGGSVADACTVLQVAGRYAAPVPIAETGLLACWALAAAGLELPAGPATVAVGRPDDEIELTGGPGRWRVSGRLHRVPWAGAAELVVALAPRGTERFVLSVPVAAASITSGHNLAGEPRDSVALDDLALADDSVAPAPENVTDETLWLRGALGRAALISGALVRVTDLTVRYTNEREQFGRPIARFQAVQHHVVRTAEQAESARIATEVAARNTESDPAFFDVATAKLVASEAASAAAKLAHQAHGAIGMTREYELGQLSRRLWTWRDEFGSERYWSSRLGHRIAALGADGLWPRITTGLVADC
ncbi:acyl-CoA dehydrogenase family protein [Saccharopolyspora endophytica]|uniref:Acyl-CoA/acyl-ACP dehydrogenase n=1 Tax=Saccharopolyspora endophytica TaxID=543886 RepID=A0ABS5DH36_9PSEU|nr:acyl-CoA dehydrogenase family protein [Saccharopolyspora endophytica]MBQ0925593.1 acyl-CoA/acyl-ACP dehydrogenase [Saccharopolyspora endophytica]